MKLSEISTHDILYCLQIPISPTTAIPAGKVIVLGVDLPGDLGMVRVRAKSGLTYLVDAAKLLPSDPLNQTLYDLVVGPYECQEAKHGLGDVFVEQTFGRMTNLELLRHISDALEQKLKDTTK
jgi:hypothetical protein